MRLGLKQIFLSAAIASVSALEAHAQVEVTEAAGSAPRESHVDQRGDVATSQNEIETDVEGEYVLPPYSVNYFGVLFGPSVESPSSSQPTPQGNIDPELPLAVLNFLGLTYNMTDRYAITGTAYWAWRPVRGQILEMRDPFVRLSDSQLVVTDNFNLYADARVHFPITDTSRDSDMLTGLQSFLVATYMPPGSRFTLQSYLSARYNVFGSQGIGNDVELYAGPNVSYQITPTVAATLLYEMGANHFFGDDPFQMVNAGTDLQPGIRWDPSPRLSVNPYLNIFTGDKVTFASTSIGMTLAWQLL